MNENTSTTPALVPAPDQPVQPEAKVGLTPAVTPVPAAAATPAQIGIDEFAKVELKIGRVVECQPHPAAERLLVMKVDLGEATARQIVAGIRADWPPEALVGKQVVICANLKPAKLRGLESQGMMLAVRGDSRVWPLTIEGVAVPGTRVT